MAKVREHKLQPESPSSGAERVLGIQRRLESALESTGSRDNEQKKLNSQAGEHELRRRRG